MPSGRNANPNHKEMSLHMHQEGYYPTKTRKTKAQKIRIVGKSA
jgi:hypothetical protein